MMSDRKLRDKELAEEMAGLLVELGADITIDDVKQAFVLGLKIGRADQALSRPTFNPNDLAYWDPSRR